ADAAPVLASREHDGSDLVNIAQIFQRSGTVFMTWKKDAIADACGLKGKKIGLWPSPADLELTSSLAACPLAAGTGYTRVEIAPGALVKAATEVTSVSAFVGHGVDASEGQIYDQVANVLETINPTTNQQYS